MSNEKLSSEEAKKISIDDLLKKLKTSRKGLTSSEIEKRRSEYGYNELPEKTLKVVKKPLPEEYRRYLERGELKKGTLTSEQVKEIRKKYEDADIYALTGATISSTAVTNGVKNIIKKFAYRVERLDSVLASQHIPVVF